MLRLNEETKVRCGKCDACRALKTVHWQFRLMQEEKRSLNALFVTLTYDTKFLPLSPSGFPTLDKKAVSAFLKRVRSFTNRTDTAMKKYKAGKRKRRPKVDQNWITDMPAIKYYGVGEYGHSFKRPHYHVIIFNAQEDAILNAWRFGSVHIGKVSGASVGYVLKYIRKRTWEGYFEGDDRQRTFAVSSKNLGLNYINEKTKRFHQNPEAYYLVNEGKILPMSRYYRDRLISPETLEEVQILQKENVYRQKPMTEQEYYEKVYEMEQINLQTINKPKKPNDLWSTDSTTQRIKTLPVKRHTGRVSPSPIKVWESKSLSHAIKEGYPLQVSSQFITYMNPPWTMTHFKLR